eukprot:1195121-Prorocentrum_minimum.AAC.4
MGGANLAEADVSEAYFVRVSPPPPHIPPHTPPDRPFPHIVGWVDSPSHRVNSPPRWVDSPPRRMCRSAPKTLAHRQRIGSASTAGCSHSQRPYLIPPPSSSASAGRVNSLPFCSCRRARTTQAGYPSRPPGVP